MTLSQRRLFCTLGGLALIIVGGIFWLVGDENSVTGDNRMDLHSAAVWGEVLNYESTEKKDYDDAKILKEKGENEKTTGLALVAFGAVVFVLRFTARPTSKVA
ncbi:hypothetical protein FNV58_01185 (plasmid) [Streptomyces sp. RLB1-9]|uniref:hypothetical protein n=1 Tax=Streptomyces sp. RLB1-9 TaxID=2594454 RepID=UPI0011639EAA|nr:hypothetical protein [Streptomyces sp. RLB1-9]QDN94975.1 hypothetical protein FNV58_01185 [Streptomyces sp. RLB1-9]